MLALHFFKNIFKTIDQVTTNNVKEGNLYKMINRQVNSRECFSVFQRFVLVRRSAATSLFRFATFSSSAKLDKSKKNGPLPG